MSETLRILTADIDEDENDELTEEEKRYHIRDDRDAEWCLRMKSEAKADLQQWKEHYDNQYRMLEESCKRRCAFFDHLLEEYFDRVPHKATKTQESYVLPGYKLIRKHPGPEYDSKSPDFLNWLKKNKLMDYIKVEESARWGEFRKTLPKDERGNLMAVMTEEGIRLVTADGEIIPGVTVTEREDVFVTEVTGK